MMITRVPSKPPPFSLSDVKAAVPSHCFHRSLVRSFSYLILDVVAISLLVLWSPWIDHWFVPQWLRWSVLWPLYWFFCGAFATGVWVIAHECGHGAFADQSWINDTVGFVCHSLLLVPYFSWKHSHRRHHQNTANLSKDEVFVPKHKDTVSDAFSLDQSWFVRLMHMVLTFTIGWPLYLLFNAASRPYPGWANHFNPYSPIFHSKERWDVVLSDLGLALVMMGLIWLGQSYSWGWLMKTYGVPYLIVNFWLVLITFLQHTHPALPHYTDTEWDWMRGALSTVDRDYGFLNVIFHHITDTHVTHHLFSKMPHYHASEATKAVRDVLGQYYRQDRRSIAVALWQDWKSCRYVAPDVAGHGILWYRR